MNFHNIAQQFLIWGHQIKTDQIVNFKNYLSEMLRRNRVITVVGDKGMECIICYFLTNDVNKFINRPMWSTPKDDQNGTIMFVDKMVSGKWTPHLRRIIQEEIQSKYPKVEGAIWLREPNNRNVIIRRRREYVYSQVS